ncbi:MAG: M48 family metalloprotease [Desulfobacterales bacterium]|jgi:Zn-dependent protease with chaperone function
MFGNFIYFIVVLLIYLTHQPSEDPNFSGFEAFALFFMLILLFSYFTWFQFQRVQRQIARVSFSRLDHLFNIVLMRQSVLAILLFAIDIYGLNLSSYLNKIALFSAVPTLQTILFLGLFVFYLAIVWYCAHSAYRKLYRDDISRQSYVTSNISFSIPVLLPWLLLSGLADLIDFLPFEWPKQFLATTEGEVAYFLLFLLAVAVLGPVLIQKFWRCKPLEGGVQRSRIEDLCEKAGLAYVDILYWPIFGGKMITAGVMGLIRKFRYILVTRALLSMLEPGEIDAVIAHEIGHVKRKHLLFYLIFFVGYMFLSYVILDFIIFSLMYAKPVLWLINTAGFNQTTVVSALFSIIIIVIFLIYFRFIFGFFMRNFERQADLFVYSLFDNARPLISTLEKIAITSGQPADRPNWHHFSIKERIDYLRKCELNPTWIKRHDRKVKKGITMYLVGLLSIGVVGYYLNVGVIGTQLNNQLIEQAILQELQKSPDNPDLYSLLGDLYYSINDFEGVSYAYEKSLALKPQNAQVLNNLAWLYATCEDHSYRDPKRALKLVEQAVELERSPHILDTLAESYYVNGMYEEAIDAGKQALKLAKKNRAYYLEQLEKFKKAAGY